MIMIIQVINTAVEWRCKNRVGSITDAMIVFGYDTVMIGGIVRQTSYMCIDVFTGLG